MSRCQSSLLDGFTDDWDAALLSEGTLRPKRAASAMNLREAMKTFTKPPLGEVTREDLENNFSRSMKLLGFDRAESASSNKSRPKPKTRKRSVKKNAKELEKLAEKRYEAKQAFEDWLEKKLEQEAAKTPPPPTPENKVTKSVQTESKPATPIPKNRPNQATNFPKNLMVPWPEFSAKNRLTSPRNQTAKTKKQKVKFADASWDVPKNLSKSYDYKDLSGIRSLSDAKTIMMLYHKQDPNSALYYARDIS
ncbi:unnamed protein product [Nesidiocoris tenuis]|uniref:Uncharacterized protein n=1 Tax=Nesidiocoris tenuis TaxID=355587 RepID=A0A6H5HQ21_9HEMI|nr:unnamed protein product [Nesidiocoris tenuis]